MQVTDLNREGFWVKITSGSNPYAWTAVYESSPGTWADWSGLSGTTTVNPAYELNGNTGVAANTRVWAEIGTDGTSLVFDASSSTGGSGSAGPGSGTGATGYGGNDLHFSRNVGDTINRWYLGASPVGEVSSSTLFTPIGERLYGFPLVVPRSITLDRIAVRIIVASGTGGAKARLGIFSATSQSNLTPSALVLDAGEIAVDSTGTKSLTISQALTAGTLYWLAYHSDASASAPQLTGISPVSCWPVWGYDSDLLNAGYGLRVDKSYGALGSWSGTATVFESDMGENNVPAIGVRLSA